MTPNEALDIIETLIPPGSLNQVKNLVFREAWEGKGYAAIAEAAGYDTDYIKGVASQLWKSLSQALGEKVTKQNFRGVLIQRFGREKGEGRGQRAAGGRGESDVGGQASAGNGHSIAVETQPNLSLTSSLPSPPLSPFPPPPTRHDWGEAPDVSTFYAREAELAQLRRWVLEEHCRLLALLGFGGIGKTTLAVKLAAQIQEHFDVIIWRSLRHAPTLDGLLNQIIPALSNQQESDMSIRSLVNWMRRSRALIILDNCETILQSGKTGHYLSAYDGYGDLFRSLGEAVHKSCVILTSREKPPEIAILEGMGEAVYSLPVTGSSALAHSILQARRLTGSQEQKQKLCNYYGNSPLALKIVASSIQDLFDGDIGEFLHQGAISFNGVRRLLDQHMQRLTPLEQRIMTWLAINRDWTAIATLANDMVPPVSRSNLLEAVESLVWRSLIEKRSGRYTLQPVVMEYVTDHLVQQIWAEIGERGSGRAGKENPAAPLLCTHALLKTNVHDYIRATQIRLILAPIADLLSHTLPTKVLMRNHLQELLDHFRLISGMAAANGLDNPRDRGEGATAVALGGGSRLPTKSAVAAGRDAGRPLPPGSGYGAGNILNLCIHLELDLTRFDFSHLTVRHAYLGKAQLHGVNFAHAHFSEAVFTQTFGSILSLAYSPKGDFVAGAGTTGRIYLWRMADGQIHTLLPGHQAWIYELAYSPDGQRLVSAAEEPCVKIWDLTTGRRLDSLSFPCLATYAVAFSPDGETLAIGSSNPDIFLYQISSRQTQLLSGHQQDILAIAFSADQRFLASGSRDGTVRLWDLQTGECLHIWNAHAALVRSVAFSQDGAWLVSGGDDCDIRRWHTQTGQCLTVFEGHQKAVYAVCISPDGRTLISGSEDQTIRCWDIIQGRCLSTLQGHEGGIWSIGLSPDGGALVSSSIDRQVRLWDMSSGNSLRTLMGYTDYAYGLAFSPDGQILAAGSSNSLVRLWDWRRETCAQTLQGHRNWVWDTAWSPDGRLLASGGLDHVVKIWRASSGNCIATLTGHENNVMKVAWHPDGDLLASAGQDNAIRLWDWDTGQCQRVMTVPQGWIHAIAWDPTGTYLASGSSDNLIRLWDRETGEVSQCLEGHQGWVEMVIWTPDGRFLVSSGHDGSIKIWDAARGQCVNTLVKHTSQVFVIAFSGDGQLLASGDFDATIHLWDTKTWDCIQTLTGHDGVISGLAFHPCQPILASGGEDETIRLWDIQTGAQLSLFRGQRPYEGMNVTGAAGLTEAEKASLGALGAIANP